MYTTGTSAFRDEILFRGLQLLEQANARRLNDPDEDLAATERAAIIAEQDVIARMAGELRR